MKFQTGGQSDVITFSPQLICVDWIYAIMSGCPPFCNRVSQIHGHMGATEKYSFPYFMLNPIFLLCQFLCHHLEVRQNDNTFSISVPIFDRFLSHSYGNVFAQSCSWYRNVREKIYELAFEFRLVRN